MHFKKIAGQQLPQRETVVYGYQPLHQDPRSLVFPPAHHRSIIAQIYGNLGLEREFSSQEVSQLGVEHSPSTSGHCPFALSTQIRSAMSTALIEIADYGPGIEEEVKNKLRDLCHKGIEVVYLNLPLGDPHTAVACQHFEELGFLFSGIQPRPARPASPEGTYSGDLLCLQYLNGPRIEYDLLQIYSDFGQELVQYVRERDPLA